MSQLATFTFLVFCINPALADPCTEVAKNYSARGVRDRAQYEFAKADAALNERYQKVVRDLKDDGRDLKPLISAERAWIVERDARCLQRAKELDLIDPTGDAAIIDCKTKWTNARIDVLKDY